MPKAESSKELPEITGWLFAFFRRHFTRLMQKNFGTLWIEKDSLERIEGIEGGAVVFFNHPSWWDAVTALVLGTRLFPQSRHYGPIDAEAIERYGFMKKIGFFGVDPDSGKGLRDFVRIGQAVSESRDAFLWVTPEGEFTDPRSRPVRFKPGLGHLAAKSKSASSLWRGK